MEITYRLKEDNAKEVYALLQSVPWDGEHQIVIKDYIRKRSKEQNSLWHVMVGQLAQIMKYTPSEMKCIVKFSLGYYHEIQGKEDTLIIYDDTHKMSVEQLTDLIEQTYQWAAEKGVVL